MEKNSEGIDSIPEQEQNSQPTAPVKAESVGESGDSRVDSRSSDRVDRLGNEKVGKLLLEFAIPAIIGMMANGLYNIIDGIFMGQGIGEVGLATATVSMPIMFFSMAIATLFGAGGNALLALRLGEGKRDEADRILGVCFTMYVIVGIICTAFILIFMGTLLRISGVDDAIYESCETFLRIIAYGMILQFFGMGFNNFIRTAGDPNRALYTMVSGIVVSTFFNWLFVLQFHWGVAGSAWATVLGQGTSFVMVMFYFTLSKKSPFKLRLKAIGIDVKIFTRIITLGSASFIMSIAGSIIALYTNNLIAHYGSLSPIGLSGAFAAVGVIGRASQVTFFPVMGVAVAASPIFGFNYGAKNFERVKTTFWTAFRWITIIGTAIWVLVRMFPEQIVMIFGIEGELLAFTAHALKVQMFMVPVMGLQSVSANFFQSSGQPFKSLVLSMSRQILFMVPLLYILPIVLPQISSQFIGLDGLYWAYPCADGLSVIIAALFMRREFGLINKQIIERDEERLAMVAG
ncbi:MAG: MATE family efflux transporter [Coriobacteriia bacterium]|nr:MATE family efflux transporter [Coriobacteriia bacterium]